MVTKPDNPLSGCEQVLIGPGIAKLWTQEEGGDISSWIYMITWLGSMVETNTQIL